jgi:hypothetical protein
VTLINAATYGVNIGEDSTIPLTEALNALPQEGGILVIPGGTYTITKPLPLRSRMKMVGDGAYGTVIHQTTPNQPAMVGTDVERIHIEGIGFTGPGKNVGTATGIQMLRQSNPNTALISMQDVVIQQWGGAGLDISNPIVSVFTKVVSENNGGDGFYLHGVPNGAAGTSTSLTGCFTVNNGGAGYHLAKMVYTAFTACAADANAVGYLLESCQGVNLRACGAEGTLAQSGKYDGSSFSLHGSTNIGMDECWVYGSSATPVTVANGSSARIRGFTNNTPAAADVQSIYVSADSTIS